MCRLTKGATIPRAQAPGSTGGWVTAALRWLWGADEGVRLRELFTSTPATWTLLAIFSAVSISDMALAGSLHESGPVIARIGQSPAYEALGQVWRFVTTTLINAPESDPPVNALMHLLGNAFLFVLTAPRVERAVGSLKVIVLFVVATICGAVAIFVGSPFYWVPGGGTSHAAYAFVGGALVIAFLRRRRSSSDAIFFGVALFVLIVNTATTAPTFPTGTNVSHLAGFIAGVVICAVWLRRPAARRAGVAVVVAFVVVAGSLAAARTVEVRRSDLAVRAEVPVAFPGFPPEGLTTGFGSLWLTAESGGSVVRVDAESGRVRARIREEGATGLPVVAADRVWVPGRRNVFAIDPTTNRVVSRIRLSGKAWGLAATADALWAALPQLGEVVRIDLRTREQTHIAVGAEPYVVAAHGRNIWVTSYVGQTVSRLDRGSGKVLAQTRVSTPPYQMAVLDGSLWVGAQEFVYRLDPVSLDVISKVDVGAKTWTLTPDQRGNLIVAARFSAYLASVDPATNKVERRIKAGLRQPIAVAFTRDMWIVDAFGNSLVRASMPE
jgi:membrane associated rhomboid family serine protease/glutamine cyclotransferase